MTRFASHFRFSGGKKSHRELRVRPHRCHGAHRNGGRRPLLQLHPGHHQPPCLQEQQVVSTSADWRSGCGGGKSSSLTAAVLNLQVPLQRRRGETLRLGTAGLRVLRRGDDCMYKTLFKTQSRDNPFLTFVLSFMFQTKTYDSVTDKFMDFSFEKVSRVEQFVFVS